MRGRRLADTPLGELPLPLDEIQPGDIWKYVLEDEDESPVSAKAMYPNSESVAGNLTDCVWGYSSPDGSGIGTLGLHTVREHEDGTISIRPGDGSSNSVLHRHGDQQWHGYVEHNEWTAC